MNKVVKWGLVAVVLAVVSNIVKESLKASEEVDARIAVTQACTRQAQKSSAVPPDRIDAVCSCTTDRTVKALGNSGFLRLAKVTNATEGDRKTMLDSLVACMEEHAPTE